MKNEPFECIIQERGAGKIKYLEEENMRLRNKLDAKLAEKEKQCRECKHLNKKIELNIKNKLMAENGELQKQLAEKDEQICRLQFEVQQALSNSLGKAIKELIEINNQDKIELLEKARTQVAQLEVIGFPEYSCVDGFESCQYRVDDIIDTLIKEIKGE